MKKLIILELFSLKRVKSFQSLREGEIELFINSISESAASATPVNLTEKLFTLTANITFKMSFGFDYRGTNFDRNRFHEVVHDAEAVAGSFSMGELIPYVGWIIDWITAHHARTERVFHELDTFFQCVFNDHLKPDRKKEKDDLMCSGVDTSAITVNWAMAELARNPRVMKKVQDEIRISLKRLEFFRSLGEEEVGLLMNPISKSATPVNLTDKLFSLVANTTFKMAFGFNYRGSNFDTDRLRFHEVIRDDEAVAGSFSTGE
ncbi:hypothetical protein GH714_028969 [Hevea brasiliensis]|uniref:Cytochrome P450 n=1 Tax=Hevea brasiliensis TaxID=3981 RepID=A0A6A6KUY7_HEVBR|nr:hypothetical protein GH714_028969 [Hevea brasiliensis]